MEFNDQLGDLVGSPVTVTEEAIEACRTKDQFGALVYELYKEAGGLVCVTSSTFIGYEGDAIRFDRNQAICAGLLVRISKFMLSVVKLSAGIEHGETVQVLNRCIIESTVNLRYLLLRDDEDIYDRFVKNSFVAERELYDMIQENIEARDGEQLAIEQNMLKSILQKCESSGVTIEEVGLRAGGWGGSFRDRLSALGLDERAYTVFQGIPSHAVHGTWMDLLNTHLIRREDGFEPDLDHLRTDGELLSPIGIFVVEAAREYLNKYFDLADAEPLRQRLDSVQERLLKVEVSRNDWQAID